jgi:hypothetical protein
MTQKWYWFSGTVVVLALLVTVAVAQSGRRNAYSISAPRGWQVDSSGTMGTDMILIAKPYKGFSANLNVVVAQAGPGQTLAQGRKYIDQTYPRMFSNYKKTGAGKHISQWCSGHHCDRDARDGHAASHVAYAPGHRSASRLHLHVYLHRRQRRLRPVRCGV